MSTRRDFLKASGIITLGLAGKPLNVPSILLKKTYPNHRPPLNKRHFVSQAVEEEIRKVKQAISDKELAWMFENCFPNTLDTTVQFKMVDGKPDTFVITGDIDAMWLRDSSAQVWPYLPFASRDSKLKNLLAGVINRQTKCLLIDTYANAFNAGPTGSSWDSDYTKMNPWLHERKWEIDSLCYPIRLAHGYWKVTGDTAPFNEQWNMAMHRIVETFRVQQRKEGKGPYHFQRKTTTPYDTQSEGGYGNPARPVGLIFSMFRPSDDATIYPLLIPSNYFAMVSLRQLAEMQEKVNGDRKFAAECRSFADEIEKTLGEYAVAKHKDFGEVLPYEVDGYGNHLFMDDANIPGLLSLPYLGGLNHQDPLYRRTRDFVLSESNPYFFKGTAGEGIGGPHVGVNMVWPMSIIMRAMTSTDNDEIISCLRMLKNTQAGTGFMHESFSKDNPKDFTRKWFAWANTLFGELIIKIFNERPGLLKSV